MNSPDLPARLDSDATQLLAEEACSLRFHAWLQKAMAELPELATRLDLARGALIYGCGATDQALYVVERGDVAVYLRDGLGSRCLVSRPGPGMLFGESALRGVAERPDEAIALTEATLLRIAAPALKAQLSDPECLAAVLEHLGTCLEIGQARAAQLLPPPRRSALPPGRLLIRGEG